MSNNLLLKVASDLCSYSHLGNYLGKFLLVGIKSCCSRLSRVHKCHLYCFFYNLLTNFHLEHEMFFYRSAIFHRTSQRYECRSWRSCYILMSSEWSTPSRVSLVMHMQCAVRVIQYDFSQLTRKMRPLLSIR